MIEIYSIPALIQTFFAISCIVWQICISIFSSFSHLEDEETSRNVQTAACRFISAVQVLALGIFGRGCVEQMETLVSVSEQLIHGAVMINMLKMISASSGPSCLSGVKHEARGADDSGLEFQEKAIFCDSIWNPIYLDEIFHFLRQGEIAGEQTQYWSLETSP